MFYRLKFLPVVLLAYSKCISALTQVIHDSSFEPDYVLRVTSESMSVACRTKDTLTVNGTTPGPAVYLKENQTTWIRVHNDLPSDNLTMHWHGLSQSVAPYSDGTPRASQWPIKAQHFFDYELRPQIGEAGTYFYHSHVDFQGVSVAGPLIVTEHAGSPPYSYDGEKILFFTEVYNQTEDVIMKGLLSPEAELGWPGEASAILVNGNSYKSLGGDQVNTTPPWAKSEGDGTCGPEVISVRPNTTYRLRAIAAVALSPFVFAIEDHRHLDIIAADGAYTQSATTDIVEMGSGQRYDILLRTKSEEELRKTDKTQFWLQIETRYRQQNNTFYAIVSYETEPAVPAAPPQKKPIYIPLQIQNWLEYVLEPLKPNGFPSASEVTRQVYLIAAQLVFKSGDYWTADNRTWTELFDHDTVHNITKSYVPYLVNIYEHGESAIPDYDNAVTNHGGWDPQHNVYPARVGEVIDIIFINEPNGISGGFDAHPWHMHGGRVFDLGAGPGTYNATANERKLRGYNPIARDTSLLYRYTVGDDEDVGAGLNYTAQGWRAWRMRVDNPGVWMIHCHTLQHMIFGMQTVWIMGNASEITRGTTPDLVSGYLTYGGNAYGNATHDPLVNHHFPS